MKTFSPSFALLLGLLASPTFAADAGAKAYAAGEYDSAYHIWLQSANKGDPAAIEHIGMLYDTGHGVSQNFDTAFEWYLRAAKAGDVHAMFDVGVCYDSGRGVPKNRLTAIDWYKKAAKNGYGRAAYDLGVIYRDGDGVPRNATTSIEYFRMAEAHGIRAGSQNLAVLDPHPAKTTPMIKTTEEDSERIKRFQKEALARENVDLAAAAAFVKILPEISQKAADGDQLSQYEIGFAFEHGIGVVKNAVHSYVFYTRASFGDDENVKSAALKGGVDVGLTLTKTEHDAALVRLFGSAEHR